MIAALQILNTAPRDDLQVGDFTITPQQLKEEERAAAAAGLERWAYYAVDDAAGDFVGLTEVLDELPAVPELLADRESVVLAGCRRLHLVGAALRGNMSPLGRMPSRLRSRSAGYSASRSRHSR